MYMMKNITTLKNKRFLFIVLALFCSFLFFVSSFFGVGVASADVVTEDNKYYYTGSNFYVPVSSYNALNGHPLSSVYDNISLGFETDLRPVERSYLIGGETYNSNLVMPVFSAFSAGKDLPLAYSKVGSDEVLLPDNSGVLSFGRYDKFLNYDVNGVSSDVTSISQITNDTYAFQSIYLQDNTSGDIPTPMSYNSSSTYSSRASNYYSIGPCLFTPKVDYVIADTTFDLNFLNPFYTGVNFDEPYYHFLVRGFDEAPIRITYYNEDSSGNITDVCQVYNDVESEERWMSSNDDSFLIEETIFFTQDYIAQFLTNNYTFSDIPRYISKVSFQSQVGFNANVVSVSFDYDLDNSIVNKIGIFNKVTYTDLNGYKFVITFYSYYSSDTINLINRFAFENRTYYLGNAFNIDDKFQLGYNEGFGKGYNKGLVIGNEQFTTETQQAIDSAYDRGKQYGESLGFSKGWQEATENEFTAGNFFSKVMSIFDVKIFGAFSMSEVFVVVLGLSLVVIVLKIFAGG